jgi:hypothetical protein
MDYRLKENRTEAFIKWYAWSVEFGDCDPAVWLTNYLNKRYEHNVEERLWLAWLYGNTYHLPTAWILKQEFPDFELATIDRITQWNAENYKRLRYQTDTKWNKGHLPAMFSSYQEFIGKGNSQDEVLRSYLGDNEKQGFANLWNAISGRLHKFGRYGTWFYMQHLAQTCDLPIYSGAPKGLKLDDYSGSRSHRNGLCYVVGKDDWIDQRLTASEYHWLEEAAFLIEEECMVRFPQLAHHFNPFNTETCLCSFKKLFRTKHGRYLGYYLDRQSEEIQQVENDGWYGIDWNVLWQARNECLDPRLSKRSKIDKKLFSSFMETGKLYRAEWLFQEEENSVGLEKFIA